MELQVDTRNLELHPDWTKKIDEEKGRLDRHHPNLVHHLRVSIEGTNHRDLPYELRIVASVPNNTLVVKRRGETVKGLIVEVFDTMGIQLKELQRKRRQEVKVHETSVAGNTGVIKSLFPLESYGFLASVDGQEIYFHENALKDVAMEQLVIGDLVRYGEGDGEKGPQATWVKQSKK